MDISTILVVAGGLVLVVLSALFLTVTFGSTSYVSVPKYNPVPMVTVTKLIIERTNLTLDVCIYYQNTYNSTTYITQIENGNYTGSTVTQTITSLSSTEVIVSTISVTYTGTSICA
ncbi:MAG: hypothetical protein ACYC7D_13145 [Nitrososphaerales archaeon]